MTFYELTFIIRQDISSVDVDKIINEFTNIINENSGKVVKTEYWGIRPLAYEIANNKKGHYVFFGLEAAPSVIQEVERKMKLSENIIRFLTIKVDEITKEPSPILRGKYSDSEEVVDVTINVSKE
jgi:small subunit ribosomal protein S6